MKAVSTRSSEATWQPGSPLFGGDSRYGDEERVHVKVLSDRRAEGGGVAYMIRFSPPEGKLIRLVAVARSDEHVYVLEGGYCNRAGEQLRFPGDYGLNPAGHPHSAFIAKETVGLVVYTGEPDEIREFAVIEREMAA